GYCDSENDVYKYQSAEYDTIRFDELTHFSESMYIYLISRLRGANNYPKQVKSSTNPGGVGHQFVKDRFISLGSAGVKHDTENGSRIFIPSKVQDNKFLLERDPQYVRRLENLSDKDKKALLYGDWDIFDGQYFSEFSRSVHVIEPFEVPSHWRWYFTMDYGFDMAAFYWIAMDEQGCAYVAREFCQGKDNGQQPLIIGDAAAAILEHTHEKISAYLAPPDLWNSRQETGRSVADIFAEKGIYLTKTGNDRVDGWMAVKEWLKPFDDVDGVRRARLRIFSSCRELIRTLPALQYDDGKPSDVAAYPHDITHSPDALRGFCVYWTRGAKSAHRKSVVGHDVFDSGGKCGRYLEGGGTY
ncbi:MAG: terminase family protein, partial [Angelakisella sp.]